MISVTAPVQTPFLEFRSHPLVQSILDAFPRAQIRTAREGLMIDPSPREIEALEAASPVAGEYLDSLGKTDLADLSRDEWMTFIEVIVTAYQDSLRSLVAQDAG